MYICLCNGLTDHDVKAAASAGIRRTSEVYRACGCVAQCGACARTIHHIIQKSGTDGEIPAMMGDD